MTASEFLDAVNSDLVEAWTSAGDFTADGATVLPRIRARNATKKLVTGVPFAELWVLPGEAPIVGLGVSGDGRTAEHNGILQFDMFVVAGSGTALLSAMRDRFQVWCVEVWERVQGFRVYEPSLPTTINAPDGFYGETTRADYIWISG